LDAINRLTALEIIESVWYNILFIIDYWVVPLFVWDGSLKSTMFNLKLQMGGEMQLKFTNKPGYWSTV